MREGVSICGSSLGEARIGSGLGIPRSAASAVGGSGKGLFRSVGVFGEPGENLPVLASLILALVKGDKAPL